MEAHQPTRLVIRPLSIVNKAFMGTKEQVAAVPPGPPRIIVMITMDFGISPGCYQVEGVKTLNYSGNSVVK